MKEEESLVTEDPELLEKLLKFGLNEFPKILKTLYNWEDGVPVY